jgi:ubiquinone/menaquinone biosynthesis C-methylase UbiE
MSIPKTNSHFDQSATTWDDNPARIALMKAVGTAILRDVQPATDVKVLDYGCGTGLVGLFLLPHVAEVTGADNSQGMLAVLQQKIRTGRLKNMRTLRLDLETDPLPGERYDLIVSSMTLHHIRDVEQVLRAFHDLLAAGGRLAFADLDTEPGDFHPPEVAGSVHHHGFDRGELTSRLCELGFKDVKHSTAFTVRKPVASGGERDFPVFLITARKMASAAVGRNTR